MQAETKQYCPNGRFGVEQTDTPVDCLRWVKMYSCNYPVSHFRTRMVDMRVTLPLLRIPPARAPILRYGVAILSTTLALIPTLLLADVAESRLAVFGVAVIVSAWYGGWELSLA